MSQLTMTINFKKDDYVWICSHPESNDIRNIWRITSAWKAQDGDVYYRARLVWCRERTSYGGTTVGVLRKFRQRIGVNPVPPLLVLAAMGDE